MAINTLETPRLICVHSGRAFGCRSTTRSRTDASAYAALPLLEQQVHDIDAEFQRLWQGNAVGRRRAGRRPANLERSVPDWDDMRDRSLAIKHGDGLTAPNRPEVFAKMRFEFRDSDPLHDLTMTMSGPVGKKPKAGAAQRQRNDA